MKLITVHVPEAYLDAIDQLVAADIYPNRSEAIRIAIRDMLKNELGGFIKFTKQETPIPEL
ncbi:MAG: ribbon-helix-helix domain-containing protein [Promethearchaeota archaeon]